MLSFVHDCMIFAKNVSNSGIFTVSGDGWKDGWFVLCWAAACGCCSYSNAIHLLRNIENNAITTDYGLIAGEHWRWLLTNVNALKRIKKYSRPHWDTFPTKYWAAHAHQNNNTYLRLTICWVKTLGQASFSY